MHPDQVGNVLVQLLGPVLWLFITLALIDTGLGALRGLIVSLRGQRGPVPHQSFDFEALKRWLSTQLGAQAALVVLGAMIAASLAPGAAKAPILAAGTAAAGTQSIVLLRDLVLKCRDLAQLLAPGVAPPPARV